MTNEEQTELDKLRQENADLRAKVGKWKQIALDRSTTATAMEDALRDAQGELSVLASYIDQPDAVWPNLGLKITAKAHKRMVQKIAALLGASSVKEETP